MTREYETSSWYIKFDDFYYFYLILIMVYLILIMAIYECTRASYKKYEIWITGKLRYKIWWFGFHITTVIFVIWHKIQTAWHFYWPKSVLKHMLSGTCQILYELGLILVNLLSPTKLPKVQSLITHLDLDLLVLTYQHIVDLRMLEPVFWKLSLREWK